MLGSDGRTGGLEILEDILLNSATYHEHKIKKLLERTILKYEWGWSLF